jgi:nucleotide-binding universal stress UspA family protein
MKILWSVNPFQDERPLQSRCEAFLRGLGKRAGSVEPVYVSSPAEFQISLEFAVPLNERYRKVASQKLEAYLKNVRGIRLRPARVIEEPGPGLADSAQALAKYAHKAGADVLVMGTHARGGLARFVLGSYAQTFLALSRTPLVLVNLKAGVSPRLRRILFATDLSPSSKRAFKALCRLASAAGASVVLMNVLERPVYWAATRGYLLVGARAVTPGSTWRI